MMKLISNDEKFNQALEQYKVEFTPSHWYEEKYKWVAVQHFQDNWDIEAPDFYGMFSRATEKADNLLSAMNYFPRGMIQEFARADAEFVRSMFINLFDESLDLGGRVSKFISNAEAMKIKYGEDKWWNHYQKANAISTYLWLRYPDKYYIYKYTVYKAIAELFGSNYVFKKGDGVQNLVNGFKLYDEICERLRGDIEIKSLLHSHLSDNCYADPCLKTLTIDFGYVVARKVNSRKIDPSGVFMPSNTLHANAPATPRIWKVSHGGGCFTADELKLLEEQYAVVVHKDTKAKGISKTTQGDDFINRMRKGDYFYLCYGNSIRLLGRIKSETAVLNEAKGGGWYQREYETIASRAIPCLIRGLRNGGRPITTRLLSRFRKRTINCSRI